MSEFKSNEPNQFLREEQQREAEEAVRAVVGVGPEPTPTRKPGEPDEEAQFEAHMRRFPGQHE